MQKIRLDIEDEHIKLASQLGTIYLALSYGVPAGLPETMDVASQVAVAAGLKALKSTWIVTGTTNDPAEWRVTE